MRQLTIGQVTITDESPPYVIAELSHNHNGSQDIAREMIRVAAACGVDAVKLQKRSAAFYAALRAKGLVEYADLRLARELTESEYWNLKAYAEQCDLAFIATAFDPESVAFVDRVGVDAIKLASGAAHNLALLDAASLTGRPILLSTGCCNMVDVERAVSVLYAQKAFSGCAVLQCTSAYPCVADDMHLNVLRTYRDRFAILIGLSSHRTDNILEPVAYGLGARIFEKHFTLSREMGAGDHVHSLDPAGLRALVDGLYTAHRALGSGKKRFLHCEETGRQRLDVAYGVPQEVVQ